MKRLKSYKYKNITFLILSLVVAVVLLKNSTFHELLLVIGSFGYFGAFLGGIMFVSTFTVATGTLILMILTEVMSPIEICLFASLGAVVGDLTIFRFVKDGLKKEIKPIFKKLNGGKIYKLLHTQYFAWLLPLIGAIVIASPLPDELGVSLMGISKIKIQNFILLSFLLNGIGIFLVVVLGQIIKS